MHLANATDVNDGSRDRINGMWIASSNFTTFRNSLRIPTLILEKVRVLSGFPSLKSSIANSHSLDEVSPSSCLGIPNIVYTRIFRDTRLIAFSAIKRVSSNFSSNNYLVHTKGRIDKSHARIRDMRV